MQACTLRRSALLALSLLASCAASGPERATRAALDAQRGAAPAEAPPPVAASEFLVARLAGQQGDLDVAASAFLDALAADPGALEVRQQAFLACLLTGRPEAEHLAEGLSDNPVAQLLLAGRAAKQGRWEDAQSRFASLPHQGMTQVLEPLLVAWAQAGAGHPDAALATLRPFVEGERFRAIYALHAALIADLAQRDPEASRLYRVAQGAFGDANLELARQLASWQARQGDTAAADHTLAALAEQSPDLAIVLPLLRRDVAARQVRRPLDGMAEAYLALAAALRQQDASEFAALVLRLALELRPDLTGARLLSSEIMTESGQVGGALHVLEPVRADDPLAPLVDLRRAALLDRLGRSEQANAVLVRLEQAYPERPEPWAVQGGLLRAQHRYPDAVAAYGEAIRRVPAPVRANWPLFYERGIALERSQRWPEAQADLERALQLAPDEPFVLNYLAYSWTEKGENLARARQMIDRAVALKPNDGAMLDSLGWVRLRQGDVDGAVHDLEHAVELEPEDATINGHLGDAYQAAGRRTEALFQWRRALTLNPEPEDTTRLQAKLREAGATVDGSTAAVAKGNPSRLPAAPTMPASEAAPAKVNLFLHVVGRRADGYHLLDSLVVFAGVADRIEAEPAEAHSLELHGPGAAALLSEPGRGEPGRASRARTSSRGRRACWPGRAGCGRACGSGCSSTCRSRPASAAARPTRRPPCGCCCGCGT